MITGKRKPITDGSRTVTDTFHCHSEKKHSYLPNSSNKILNKNVNITGFTLQIYVWGMMGADITTTTRTFTAGMQLLLKMVQKKPYTYMYSHLCCRHDSIVVVVVLVLVVYSRD
jgi:hypothetical protein